MQTQVTTCQDKVLKNCVIFCNCNCVAYKDTNACEFILTIFFFNKIGFIDFLN